MTLSRFMFVGLGLVLLDILLDYCLYVVCHMSYVICRFLVGLLQWSTPTTYILQYSTTS
jgi:hypothetical protein